jgi:hypothetical protein
MPRPGPGQLGARWPVGAGDMVEYSLDQKKPRKMGRVESVSSAGLRVHGCRGLLSFDKVQTVYSRSVFQRGVGETLLLNAKIKQGRKVYENGSRQTIESIDNGEIRFCSGLALSKEDGRVVAWRIPRAHASKRFAGANVLQWRRIPPRS